LGIYTVTPAGILLSSKEKEKAYSMTLLEEGLTTLDSIDWSNYYPDIEQNPGMNELWRAVSGQSAMLHSEGNKAHGDMAARNIATGTESAVFFIDWEYATIGRQAPRDAEGRYTNSYADLSVLLESMCLPPHANIGGKAGIGIFYGKQGDWWEGFCRIFYDEYIHTRTELSTQGGHHKQTECEVAEELHELTRTLRQNMEMMKCICDSIPAVNRRAG